MKKSSFLEGALIATIAIFITKFLGIIYVIPFYSIVGDQGGALYGYAYNIYNFFLVISSAGIPLAISKLTSEYNTLKKYKEKNFMFKEAQKIIFAFSIICFLICFIFAKPIASIILGNVSGGNTIEDVTFVIRCVSFAILVVPLLSIIKGYLQGHGFIKPSSISQVLEQLIRIFVIIFGSYLTLKVFNLSLRTAIGVAVFGAAAGAIIAYLYLIRKMKLITKDSIENTNDLNKEQKKDILKKLIYYAIPFIIINVANSLYNTTDMILLNRGLEFLGYEGPETETIISVFTTWGHKLNMIVTSIATGVAVSLIPSISASRAKNDNKDINDKINKLLQIFFYIALPLALFMSLFAKEIWTIFYGTSYYGPRIFRLLILTAAADALYIMINNALQGLNKTKLIYTAVISGLLTNLCLDVPLMILLNKIGIDAYYGAVLATLIGYGVSLTIAIVSLKKDFKINFNSTLKKLPKLFGIYIIMIFLSLVYRVIINNVTSRILLILLLCIIGIILVILYFFLNKREIEEILGYNIKNKLRKKREK